jgi:hypothetical protein
MLEVQHNHPCCQLALMSHLSSEHGGQGLLLQTALKLYVCALCPDSSVAAACEAAWDWWQLQ